MKPTTLLLTLSTVVLLLTGCASTESGSASGKNKPYPLQVCIVTDNELGSMGAPITMVHEGQIVKFCCKPCVKEFKADPAKYLLKIK